MAKEIQSTSPDGFYTVQCEPWEPRMSLWVYSPEIVENETCKIVFSFCDPNWSAEYSTWLGPTKVQLGLQKYPGDKLPQGIVVDIDLINQVALLENHQIGLHELEALLERRLKNA
jgi:hypothetical protein